MANVGTDCPIHYGATFAPKNLEAQATIASQGHTCPGRREPEKAEGPAPPRIRSCRNRLTRLLFRANPDLDSGLALLNPDPPDVALSTGCSMRSAEAPQGAGSKKTEARLKAPDRKKRGPGVDLQAQCVGIVPGGVRHPVLPMFAGTPNAGTWCFNPQLPEWEMPGRRRQFPRVTGIAFSSGICNGGANQKWLPIPDQPPTSATRSSWRTPADGKCRWTPNGLTNNGDWVAALGLWEGHAPANQTWDWWAA